MCVGLWFGHNYRVSQHFVLVVFSIIRIPLSYLVFYKIESSYTTSYWQVASQGECIRF